jgi:hypothetical protein
MILAMYRDDQHVSYWAAFQAGAVRAIHIDDHHYKGKDSGKVADACEVIIATSDMLQGDSLITCVLMEDNHKFIDTFQLAGAHFELYGISTFGVPPESHKVR